MLTRNLAQHKSRLLTLANGLTVLWVIGLGLFRRNPATSANTAATATALNLPQAYATAHAYETWDRATLIAEAPDKATQEAIRELTSPPLPTSTWFDKMATEESLLTTSPTPWPTEPSAPWPFIQRPAGAGRLVLPEMGICGYNHNCSPQNFWIEKTKDKFIEVYAGRDFAGPDASVRAIVYIEWHSLSDYKPMPGGGGTFPAPVPAWDMRIVDATREQLTLLTNDGTRLVFDVPSRQYISVPASEIAARAQHPANGGALFENSDVSFTGPGFSAINRWAGKNGKAQITVFAGAEGGSPTDYFAGKPALAVVASQGPPTAADVPQVYYPPDEFLNGALWIFDVKGNLVALVDQGSHRFFFDLITRQFIDGLDAEKIKVFTAPLFDPNMPISQATPAPVMPFIPPTPVSTSVSNAYP